jgi:hypothetical protein
MLQVLVATSQKFCRKKRERHVAMQELFIKKRNKKWTSVRDIENNEYSDTHLNKEKR